jgi:hypothetical protein
MNCHMSTKSTTYGMHCNMGNPMAFSQIAPLPPTQLSMYVILPIPKMSRLYAHLHATFRPIDFSLKPFEPPRCLLPPCTTESN